jgi:hypothetical protein
VWASRATLSAERRVGSVGIMGSTAMIPVVVVVRA